MLMYAIPREILILSIWLMVKKKFLFDHITDIRDEPARYGPAMTMFDGLKTYIIRANESRLYKVLEVVLIIPDIPKRSAPELHGMSLLALNVN